MAFEIFHKAPQSLSNKELEEVVKLHRSYFTISADKIIELLMKRDIVVLYRNKETREIVGTIGFSIIRNNKKTMIYIGNTVIAEELSHSGLTSKSVFNQIIKAQMCHPFHKVYLVCLSSSPQTFKLCSRLAAWPRVNETTPDEINELMKFFIKVNFEDYYTIHNGNYIINTIKNSNEKLYSKKNYFNEKNQQDPFYILNPNAQSGEQLLCVSEVNFHLVKVIILMFGKKVLSRFLKLHPKVKELTSSQKRDD